MDRVRNIVPAAALASLAGGPILVALVAIDTLLSGEPVHVDIAEAAWSLTAMVWVGVLGWAFAILPNLIGSFALGWLGRFNVGMRFPAVWGIVGALTGSALGWLSSGTYDTWRTIAAMAGIGAVSALLCRAKVRWDDESAAPPAEALTPARPRATP